MLGVQYIMATIIAGKENDEFKLYEMMESLAIPGLFDNFNWLDNACLLLKLHRPIYLSFQWLESFTK